MNSICLPRIDEAPEETWHAETAKVDCLNEPSFQEWPTLSSDKVQGELGSCVAQVNLPTMFAKQEELKPLCDSFNLFIAPEQYQDTVYAFLFFFLSFGCYVKCIPLFMAPRHLFIYSLHFLSLQQSEAVRTVGDLTREKARHCLGADSNCKSTGSTTYNLSIQDQW